MQRLLVLHRNWVMRRIMYAEHSVLLGSMDVESPPIDPVPVAQMEVNQVFDSLEL